MTDGSEVDRWTGERTVFQRVYDVIVGTESFESAADVADRAACSTNGAREALDQLVEMGIAQRSEGRPASYRRNDAYLTWKRVERLAHEHSVEELREKLAELTAAEDRFRERFDVADPDAVSPADVPVDDHEAMEKRWEALGEWRTVRRDVRVLRRAVQRAESTGDDRVRA